MKKFLQQVARAYYVNERTSLGDYCFVFPNKRSGQFFLHHLRSIAEKPVLTPDITTMTRFVGEFYDVPEASPTEQLFILYDEYRRLSDDLPSFDRFRYWGEMLLHDFDEIERYLVDADMLFGNIKAFKEIRSNYLTDEQREIISRFWPESLAAEADAEGDFWLRMTDDTPSQRKFLKLWQVLSPLYHNFNEALQKRHLTTAGRLYREAIAAVGARGAEAVRARRVVFVGFNLLSPAELKLMSLLQKAGIADFYWKAASPFLDIEGNHAGDFVRRYAGRFPSRHPVDDGEKTMPQVSIIGSPSQTGQTSITGTIVGKWIREGKIADPSNAVDTVILLPDESLLIPMLDSLPREMPMNITMGIPMSQTPIASLMRDIASMHLRSRSLTDGNTTYFHEDVRHLLSQPLIKAIAPEATRQLLTDMSMRRIFMLDGSEAAKAYPELAPLFAPIPDRNSFADIAAYIYRLLDYLERGCAGDGMEQIFISDYRYALDNLGDMTARYGIEMADATAWRILERTVGQQSVRFEGEPLRGLQVMGVLESRALDFDNVIILSMNENIFPRHRGARSFIPETLRRGYGMPVGNFAESDSAYHFYSIISRARNVALLYDMRRGTGKTEGMSRYLFQLLYLSGLKSIRHSAAVFAPQAFEKNAISVSAGDEIREKIDRFTLDPDHPDRRNISASSINALINCPLQFYLAQIEGLNMEEDIMDYVDSSTYGSVFHRVMETLYIRLRDENPGRPVTSERLSRLIDPKSAELDPFITTAINELHNNLGKNCRAKLTGSALVLGRIIRFQVRKLLELEMPLTPIMFEQAEWKREYRWPLSNGRTVNFKMSIDRIDRVKTNPDGTGGTLRIVDYKTGGDRVTFSNLEELFDPGNNERRKAILQLVLYSHVYRELTGYTGPITPTIYLVKTLFTTGLTPIKFDGSAVDDVTPLIGPVMERLDSIVSGLFDDNLTFTATDNEHNCTFCTFKAFCGRS